ncbi:ABC transporter permease YtrF precursor [Posidoniimonas corsicana]|uniref:ABC transporter permease YtrF n=1 Tax=Posidoniimonas corsicana TaxID=1938618 RepID=A0A5C5VFW2_9BACT|nr:FtsX-like permease family protein [Posidoniimonas corsicana]TWT36847.1 ABC transporter permease YtrF precursor [Posidoniimonas corsicana]
MSFWTIAWRNMWQRALASSLTGLSMALGVAVMICVIVIHSVAVRQFSQDAAGYHLIIGSGKGSKTDLVLSTVFHVGTPLFPVPYAYYRDFTDGKYADVTKVAIPYCLGDSYEANGKLFRVVGVTRDLFDKIQFGTNADGSPRVYEFAEGQNFKTDKPFQAVVGSIVAQQAGLKVGSTFNPTHGISAEGDKHEAFEIVGVLEPTGTANDRAVFVNIEGFYLLAGHSLSKPHEGIETPPPPAADSELKGVVSQTRLYDNEGGEVEPLPPELREVTSILVLCNNAFGPNSLIYSINKDATRSAQAVAPGGVVTKLLEEIVGPVQVVLLVLTIMIVVVASISILVSIYNSMSERSHDIAVMRALGASRVAVMLIVLFESILLSVAGGLAGILLGHLIIGAAAPYVVETTGVRLAVWEFDRLELIIIPALVVLASLAGFLPALSAYRTDVARALSGTR